MKRLPTIATAIALVGFGYALRGCLDGPPDVEAYERGVATSDSLRDAAEQEAARIDSTTTATIDSLSTALAAEKAESARLRRTAAAAAAEADAANTRADELLDAYQNERRMEGLRLESRADPSGQPTDCPEALDACTTARRATVRALRDEQDAHASTGRELLLVSEQASAYASAYDSLRLGVVPDLRVALLHSEEAREIAFDVGFGKGKARGHIEAAVVVGIGLLAWGVTR